MRRSLNEILQRAFDNALANWPLLLLRAATTFIALLLCVGAVVMVVMPIGVAALLAGFSFNMRDFDAEAFLAKLTSAWVLWLWVLPIAAVVLLALVAIYTFLEAGSARIYVDGERLAAASGSPMPQRDAFRAFSGKRFLAGAREGWWRVFSVWNIGWTFGSLVILVPALVVLLAVLLGRGSAAAIVIGCLGIAVILLVTIVVFFLTALWVGKATAVTIARGLAPNDALRAAWGELRRDFARHAIVVVISIGLSMALGMLFSALPLPFRALGTRSVLFFAGVSVHVGSWILNQACSAAINGWLLAAFVSLTEDQ